MVVLWLFTDYLARAYDEFVVPLLGFFLLPTTTLAYAVAHNEVGGALFKIRKDPRITPVGRFLRRWSLDELPQVFNVVRGEMSLVGPRPLPQRDYDRLDDWHRKRYLVLPGITGLWQISGRSELDFDELVRLDFLYLERWSVYLDLSVLLKTIPAVFRARGAW
jgi:lipopolysaccharide/colanic/teichoic acid biosynthesis glycosyltransferase